jgi:uncharacterized protein YfaP (DUF2135 family)
MDHSVQPLHVISYDGDHYWWGKQLMNKPNVWSETKHHKVSE